MSLQLGVLQNQDRMTLSASSDSWTLKSGNLTVMKGRRLTKPTNHLYNTCRKLKDFKLVTKFSYSFLSNVFLILY